MKSFAKIAVSTLTARIAEIHSKDTETAIKYFTDYSVAIDTCMNRPEFKEIGNRLIKNMRIADEKQDKANYIAVKVCIKIARCMIAIGQGMPGIIDAHTKIMGAQLAKLSKLTNKSAMVAQSKSAVYTELDYVQELDYKKTSNYSLNTADTQTSSTRMLFNYLGMCDVIKGKKGDVIEIQDNERARAFIALFRDAA